MKIEQIAIMQPHLVALCQIKIDPNSRPAYCLRKALAQTGSIMRDVDRKQKALYRKHGVIDAADSNKVNIPPEAIEAFSAEWEAIMQTEIEPNFLKFTAAEWGVLPVEPIHMAAIDGILLADDPVAV